MTFEIEKLDFAKGNGLIPVVVQDVVTHQVLMLGYMNHEAVEKTVASNQVTFFSRSKQRIWTKGESSGNTLAVASIHVDCDFDTLLIRATPAGPVCHTGDSTCFHDDIIEDSRFLGALSKIVKDRATSNDPESSYTASLLAKGVKRVSQKVGEEGVEVALAGVAGDKDELLSEAADLLYHLLVLLEVNGMSLDEVGAKLGERHKAV